MKLHRASMAASLLASALLATNVLAARPTFPPAGATNTTSQQPALPQGVSRLTSVEGITEYRLDNGLRVLLFPDQTKQTATVNITYLVGSRHESYGETGMAHLLEHLVFKGTPRHPNIPQEMTTHGARPNGTTWFDRTNYYETFAATDENLEWALDLEADRMINSFIAKKDLDSEMTVVRNEYESGENRPFRVMLDRLMSAAYLWHNYGNSTIGARTDIENVPIERLQAFYKNYYQPDNAVLLVAGKFDEAKALNLIAKHFGKLPRPARRLPQIYTAEPVQDGERAVTVRRVGDTQLVAAGYHVPPGPHPDFAAFNVLTPILADTPAGRLHKALVEAKKASSSFGSSFQLKEPGFAFFGAEVRQDGQLDAARDALLSTIEGVPANPPTKEEVERAKTSILKNIDLMLNSSERVGLGMSEWIAQGDWRLFFIHRDRVRQVTPEDVGRVAAKYLKSSNRTLGTFIPTAKPDRAEVPSVSEAEVAALVKDYKGGAGVAAGEAFEPSPANVEARTRRTSLPNGLEVALLPKETRGDAVVAALTLRFGDEQSLINRSTAAQLAAQMLMRGTKSKTRQQIGDELDRLKARVQITGGATQATVFVETVRENLPAVLRLISEVLREQSFPESEFEQLKQEQLASVEQQKSDPQALGSNLFNRHTSPFPKGHAFYTPTPDERIANLKATTLEDVKKFYTDFYGASNAQLAVVGDFDEKQLAEALGAAFGGWKSPRRFTRMANVYFDVPAINKVIETPDKANAFFIAGLNLKARDDNPDYPALVLGNYMLGGGFLNSRLATRIRQKEGLSYGVGSSLLVSSLDEFGTFTASAIYAPQNVEKLEAAFKEEIARMLKEGFTAEEIADAKRGYLQSRQVSRAQDASLARQLAFYLFLDRTLDWDDEFEKKVAALTPEQVTAAMQRHVDPSKITIVKAGDFKAATPVQ